MGLNFNKVEFIRSAVKPADFLRDGLPQMAFAGRITALSWWVALQCTPSLSDGEEKKQ